MNGQLIFIIFLIFLTSVCDTVNQICLKSSINAISLHVDSLKKVFQLIFKIALVPRVWIAFAFSCLSLFLWLFVLSRADLSFAYALDSMHYVLIAFASGVFLKENVGARRWVGTALIMAGLILVALTGGG